MLIRWFGHACFSLTLKDGRIIVTDPFDDSVGYEKPDIDCDIVTVSHNHHDHNCLDALKSFKRVLIEKTVYFEDGLKITSLSSFHDEAKGTKRGNNLIFKIEAEGKTIVHLGDLGHLPDDEHLRFIKGCDVLLLPIGGTYTITSQDAVSIMKSAEAGCTIPMHYLTPALSFPLADEKRFAEEANAVYLGKNEENVDFLSGCVIMDY